MENILDRVQFIMQDVFDNDNLIVNSESTVNDVEKWDSFSHVSLIINIEKEFNIKLWVFT